MTKLITILIIVAAIFVGYRLYLYWEKVDSERDIAEQKASRRVDPHQLSGMPYELEDSLSKAQQNVHNLGKWLDAFGGQIQDPRLAWIELDYCTGLLLDNPREAKRIFNAVKARTPTNSPVYSRIKEYQRTFE